MKLNDDFYDDESKSGSNMTYIYMALIMSTIILGVTALVFWVNKTNNSSSGSGYAAAVAQREARMMEQGETEPVEGMEDIISNSNLTSDELDIWTLPDTGRENKKKTSGNGTVTNQTTGETVVDGSSSDKDVTTADELVDGKTSIYNVTDKEDIDKDKSDSDNSSKDDKSDKDKEDDKDDDDEEEDRTRIVKADGSKEWVDINDDIARHEYDFSKLKYSAPIMKYYDKNDKEASWFGVDISANQGKVDYDKLKEAGCEFVMLKVGARGYSSGNIVMDKKFEDNVEDAEDAKLKIGVYFCSQAVTKSEAREEAECLLDAIEKYDINYPIVFVMENIEDDMSRIEALNLDERTDIARVFMEDIEDAGYTPMLYGNKEWLLTMIDLEELSDYDVWLAQNGNEPDYPYEFGMWQYETEGKIKGISGDVALSISFVDYSKY